MTSIGGPRRRHLKQTTPDILFLSEELGHLDSIRACGYDGILTSIVHRKGPVPAM